MCAPSTRKLASTCMESAPGAHDRHVGDVAGSHAAPVVGIHPEPVSGAHEPAADLVPAAQVGALIGAGDGDPQHGVLGEEGDRVLAAVVVDELHEEVDSLGGTHDREG